jgi:hypothetical protein
MRTIAYRPAGRRALAVLMLTGATLTCPLSVRAAVSPLAVNMRVTDLPKGFQRLGLRQETAVQLLSQGGSHAFRLTLAGLTVAEFEVFGSSARRGITYVESDLLYYRSAANAHADFVRAARSPVRAPGQRLATSGLGDEVTAHTEVVANKTVRERFDDFVVRRGRYILVMRAAGRDGTFSTVQVAAGARAVDTRIHRLAGGGA